MKYAVNVSWGMFGTLYVEADNVGHARLLANALPTPEGAYIEGSFKLGDVQPDEDTTVAPSRITNKEAELNQ